MQHILSVAFDFDDERITKSIEGQVHKEVVDNITNEIKQIIYRKRWTGYVYEKEDPECSGIPADRGVPGRLRRQPHPRRQLPTRRHR